MKYRINYQKVINQANAIADNASQLAAQIRILEQIEQECGTAWKGEAANVFLSKLRALREEMTRSKNQISNLASTIRYCADRIQKEDSQAQERAAALKSGH